MVRKIHLATLLIPLIATIAAVPAQAAGVPSVSAKAAIVIDGVTGQVLYAKNIHDRLPQASTTKMMAGIVALERGTLSDEVQVSKRAADTEGSSMYLEAGERLTFEQLLYGMMLNSGNDATEAVAEYISGDATHFVGLMNQKASTLGLKNTHFVTPHGLPDSNHYSSAYDLAQIARYALSNPAFAEIAATKAFPVPGNKRAPHRTLINHNKLLRYFPGAWGGKTGYTIVAGKCFVGSAKRDGRYVIEALLSAPDCWADAEKLLNYGLDSFTSEPVAAAGQAMGDVKVQGGAQGSVKAVLTEAVALSVPKGGQKPEVTTRVKLEPEIKAPVKAGQSLGTYELREGDRLLASAPLVAALDVPVGGLELGDLGAVFGWFLKGGALSVALFSVFRWQGMRRRGRRKRGKSILGSSNAIHR
ncbi:D-alanyl-D-alanine carboxypeptidase [bacterium]|nr:D-alanyl-D-alanine carboxypeptidase [bacterium]